MKVFLSWSGSLSHRAALVLKDWLPNVIQQLDPFVSSEDIDKGARWANQLGRELEKCSYGIVCLTRTSLNAPWINFETGALSKQIDTSRVSNLLLGLSPQDVGYPLAQFQNTIYTEADIKKLVESLNRNLPTSPVNQVLLDNAFHMWWPSLKADLDPLVEEAKTEPIEQPRTVGVTNEETLGEFLEMVREQNRILAGRNWEQIWRGSLSAGSYITQGHTLRYIQRQLQLLSEVRDLPSDGLLEKVKELDRYINNVKGPLPIFVPEGNTYTTVSPHDKAWIEWTASPEKPASRTDGEDALDS